MTDTTSTEPTVTYDLWKDEELTGQQRRALMNLENKVESMRRHLQDIQKYASSALVDLSGGRMIDNWFRQPVSDFTETRAQIAGLVNIAEILEIPVEKIQAVYSAAGNGR